MTSKLTNYDLRRLRTADMGQKEFEAARKLLNAFRAEDYPGDPPRSLEYTINNLKSLEDLKTRDFRLWFLWEGAKAVAMVHAQVTLEAANKHLLKATIMVHPDYRRRGLATALMPTVLNMTSELKRRLVTGWTRGPAGATFAKALGAEIGIDFKINQLRFADIPVGLVETWLNETEACTKDYCLGLWEGALPEAEIDAIAKMVEVMNTAPRDNLKVEDEPTTPEMLREREGNMFARGVERWMYYVRHKATGELAGYTEILLNPEEFDKVQQGDTGVLPAHRGHGLGKYLKASMIQKLQAERPNIKRIHTGNADSNAPMLVINHALGFKPYQAVSQWQVEVSKIKAYLEARA